MKKEISAEKKAVWSRLSKEIADEGIILLKNDNNALPLKGEKLAVFGQAQLVNVNASFPGGCIITEIRNSGIEISEKMYSLYKAWEDGKEGSKNYKGNMAVIASDPEMPITAEEVASAKTEGAEKALIVLSRISWENSDMAVREGDYILSADEKVMIENVCSVFDSVILVLRIGCNIDLGFLDENKIDAVIYAGVMKEMGAVSLADILLGRVNPSGKLTYTMAKHFENYPSSGHFGQHGGGLIQDYTEDIFVGYRYFDTFNRSEDVVFPFGSGCSYTDFAVSGLTLSESEGIITVTAQVTNMGNEYAGKEALQLYYSAPSLKDGALLGKPRKALCGIAKTSLLAPGEKETVSFSVALKDMASYDDTGKTGRANAWVLEKGDYTFYVGKSSADYEKAGVYTQAETVYTELCNKVATTLPERLTEDGSYEALPQPMHSADAPVVIPTDRVISLPVTDYSSCEGKIKEKLSELSVNESVSYKLMPGAGGSYAIRFATQRGYAEIDGALEASVDGNKAALNKISDAEYEISLPLARCELTFTLKSKVEAITDIEFKKIDTVVKLDPECENVISAQNFYEGSFCINVDSSECGEENTLESYVTNFIARGMNVIYKLEIESGDFYDISFKYAFCGENVGINRTMTVSVSNIVQHLSGAEFVKTYNEGEKKSFALSDGMNIFLPTGTAYLKIVAEALPFPDISEIRLVKSEEKAAEAEEILTSEEVKDNIIEAALIAADNGVREGMQLYEVMENPSKMREFLDSLSNNELAMVVSGTGLNAIPDGYVGCNHPNYKRGIPPVQTADGADGLFLVFSDAVKYNAPLTLASTYNRALYKRYGDAIGEEAEYYGIDLWLAPSINILRSPIGGRNHSYASEDPYISGIFAADQIEALQKYGVGAVLKHYCANNTEYERLKSNSRVSERALREIYIKGFEMAVKMSDPYAIMSSYNHVNNVKACEDRVLITDIPRNEWDWKGVFVTDWWNDSSHVEELKAGHDLKMATGDIDGVTAALENGELSREDCYPSAERILNMLMRVKTTREFLEREAQKNK